MCSTGKDSSVGRNPFDKGVVPNKQKILSLPTHSAYLTIKQLSFHRGFFIAAGKPVYRNSCGEESYLAGRKPEQRCSPARTWCYVLGLSGSGTQKTVYVPDEGSFILVSAGLEAKVTRVVYSHRNPANYNTNLRTSDEAGEQHTNRRIAGYVNSHHSGNATSELDTSTVYNKLEPIAKWARGCFARKHHVHLGCSYE